MRKLHVTRVNVYHRKTWEYFDRMDSILGQKPEYEPPAVASSSGALYTCPVRKDCGNTTTATESLESKGPKKRKASVPLGTEDYFRQKLELEKEKVGELRRFNNLFEKYILRSDEAQSSQNPDPDD